METMTAKALVSMEQKLLDDSPNAVVFVTPEWQIGYINRRAAEVAHSGAEHIAGSSFWTAFPEFAEAETERHFRRAMEEQVEIEFEHETSSGEWLQVCLRPGEPGLAFYGRDITRFKHTERALLERESELSDFFENGSIALHWVGPDGVILWANEAELSILGYTADEYIGRNIRDFHVDPSEIEDILHRLARNEKLLNYESRLRCKDGSVREVAISSSVYRRNGQFIHTRCFTRDVTAERARVAFQERLGAIVESSDDAIISKDLNGIITSWNRSAERLFGFTSEEAIGQSVATLIIPDDRQAEEPEILSNLAKGNRVEHFQTKRKRKDGTLLDISLTISPVRDARGRIVGASKIARDITEQVRNQEALSRANEALRRSNADLEHFAYSASHDLQEPLRMVLTYAEMLRKKYRGNFDKRADESLDFVAEGGSRMERLLHDLRAFTRASINNDGSFPSADAQTVLTNALTNLRPVIEQSGAEITFSSFRTLSEMRSVTGVKLHQAFTSRRNAKGTAGDSPSGTTASG
jgi:hypothetical protein